MFNRRTAFLSLSVGLTSLLVGACSNSHAHEMSTTSSTTTATTTKTAVQTIIDPWQPRFGRQRPVIAVLAVNSGTELTDYVIPFGVLSAADVADITTVSTGPGSVTMRPALRTQAQMTVNEFDTRYPQGADYVIVPALRPRDDPAAVEWIKTQAAKGGSTVSICNGAFTVAETGLMDNHQATSHWAGEKQRAEKYPNIQWQSNIRYIADRRIISSAGISASMPISIALVAAIAGQDHAEATARSLGITDWSPHHNSASFANQPGQPVMRHTQDDSGDAIGVELTPTVDEIAFALTAEAYSHTGVSKAYAVADTLAPVQSLRGLTILPERTYGDPQLATVVPPGSPDGRSAEALDKALADIASSYGRTAASSSARVMEYPGYC